MEKSFMTVRTRLPDFGISSEARTASLRLRLWSPVRTGLPSLGNSLSFLLPPSVRPRLPGLGISSQGRTASLSLRFLSPARTGLPSLGICLSPASRTPSILGLSRLRSVASHGDVPAPEPKQAEPKELGAGAGASQEQESTSPIRMFFSFVFYAAARIALQSQSKQVLKEFPFPYAVTAAQFGFSTVMIGLVCPWKRQNIDRAKIAEVFPFAMMFMLGILFKNISHTQNPIPYASMIKEMDVFITIVLSAAIVGEIPYIMMFSSLVSIGVGSICISLIEPSFTWFEYLKGMAFRLLDLIYVILTKKLEKESPHSSSFLLMMTIISFCFVAPLCCFMEGAKLKNFFNSSGLDLKHFVLIFASLLVSFFLCHQLLTWPCKKFYQPKAKEEERPKTQGREEAKDEREAKEGQEREGGQGREEAKGGQA